MPLNIDIERLDDGDGLDTTMRKHSASWHKSCHLKFNQTQLERARKRNTMEEKKEIVEKDALIEQDGKEVDYGM